MVATNDFRKGMTKILFRNDPWLVVDFAHVKPGKGGAFVRVKLRNLRTGVLYEDTLRAGEKFESPDLSITKMQFLYKEGDFYHFLDQESFDQNSFTALQLGAAQNYLKEGELYEVMSFENAPLSVEPPLFMILKIIETVPGVRGNTAQGGSKAAKLETGAVVQVPLFVEEGELIKVDTRDNSYVERV